MTATEKAVAKAREDAEKFRKLGWPLDEARALLRLALALIEDAQDWQ